MPGTPFTQHQFSVQFDRAIGDGEVGRAWNLARRLDPMPLDRALSLTILLGRAGDPRFEGAARRFLVRWMQDAAPDLARVPEVAGALASLSRTRDLPAMADEAAGALERLARRLGEQA